MTLVDRGIAVNQRTIITLTEILDGIPRGRTLFIPTNASGGRAICMRESYVVLGLVKNQKGKEEEEEEEEGFKSRKKK